MASSIERGSHVDPPVESGAVPELWPVDALVDVLISNVSWGVVEVVAPLLGTSVPPASV